MSHPKEKIGKLQEIFLLESSISQEILTT